MIGSLGSLVHEYAVCDPGIARAIGRAHVRAAELSWRRVHTTAHAPYTRRLRHPETPVELSFSLFDSFSEFICSKGSSSVGYRLDWCINHHLYSQTNSSVGLMKKKKKTGFDQFPCIPVAVYFSYFGSVVG